LGGRGPFNLAEGQFTDDSEMAMCIIHGLIHETSNRLFVPSNVENGCVAYEGVGNKLPIDVHGIQQYFGRWAHHDVFPPFDIGMTTSKSLSKLDKLFNKRRGEHDPMKYSYSHNITVTKTSISNGCLMRITPFAVFCHKLETDEDLYAAVTLQTALTHSNKTAIDSCYLYCYAIRELIRNGDAKSAYEKTKAQLKNPAGKPQLD
jgi:ADP-ribosyl-[dinitrogen reductase] hydrolase